MANKNNSPISLIENQAGYKEVYDEMNALVSLAVEVYDARNAKKWTQTRLAKEVGTTQKVISKIESANVNIGLDLLQRLARSLDLKLQIGNKILVPVVNITKQKDLIQIYSS